MDSRPQVMVHSEGHRTNHCTRAAFAATPSGLRVLYLPLCPKKHIPDIATPLATLGLSTTAPPTTHDPHQQFPRFHAKGWKQSITRGG